MENKTKVKVAVVIGIVILAVIFIVMVVFVKGNKTPVNTNIPRKGEEGYVDTTGKTDGNSNEIEDPSEDSGETISLDGVISVGIKNGNIVKINEDLESTTIKNLEDGYIEMCYGDSNIYVAIKNEDNTVSIKEINIENSNYPENTIIETDKYGIIHNLEYYAGKIYFVSEHGQLIEHSISENLDRAITNENEVSSFTINKNANNMLISYSPNNQNAGVYIFDFTANSLTQIIALTQLPGQLILNGNSLIIDVKELGSLYAYDMEAKSVAEVGIENNKFKQVADQVAFYENTLLFTNGNAIDIKKVNGESFQDGWYSLNDNSIAGISMLDSSKLQVARWAESGENKITRSTIIDLSTGSVTEVPDYAYTDIIKLEK